MSVQLLLPTYDFGKRPKWQKPIYKKYAHTGAMSIQQKAVDIRHKKYAHTCDSFPVQTVHLVVDSGELGQPDGAFVLEGMARRRTYDGRHTTLVNSQLD